VTGWTIAEIVETAARYLRDKGSSSPRLDAELLLAETLGMDRIHLYAHHDRPLAPDEVDRYRELIGRRGRLEPVAYILGHGHFRYLRLELTPAVLIPRPETEELVDAVIDWLKVRPLWAPPGEPPGAPRAPLIVDVGTGSGAIALSLAQETGYRVLATDLSDEALAVAARNRAALGLDSLVSLSHIDLLTGVEPYSFRVVVSNPPYISRAELAGLAPDVRDHEPLAALDGGLDGLETYRRLLPQAARALGPGGAVFLEVGHRQADDVCDLAREAGFALAKTTKDLSGKARIVSAVSPGAVTISLARISPEQTSAVATALAAGSIVGVPTDTVYGLGAAWDSTAGVRNLFAAKGRGEEKPVAVLFASVKAARESLPDLGVEAGRILEALLPGPYTFVVSTSVERAPLVGDADSLGIRVPDCPELLDFLARLGVPLAATSANLAGRPDPMSVRDVDSLVLAHCSVALVRGPEPPTRKAPGAADATARGSAGVDRPVAASTVVDLRPLNTGGQPVVLREGAVSRLEVLTRIAGLR